MIFIVPAERRQANSGGQKCIASIVENACLYGSRERHSCSRSHVRVHDHVHNCCVVVRLFLVTRVSQGDAKLGNLLLKEY